MTTRKWMMGGLAALLVAGVSAWVLCGVLSCGICKPNLSGHPQTDLQSVLEDRSERIASYEEKYGEVFVSLVDRVGDCHIFLLKHPGKSAKETLALLKTKQEEQAKSRPNELPEGICTNAPNLQH